MEMKTVAAGIALLAITGLTGCASTSEIQGMKDQIAQAQSTADAAARDAAAAKAAAAAAQATANEAKAKADETDDKINRMFKKSMYK
ncbi:MAG: Lpp/OprI family alanine-zipper lipoprotein [Gammaproteobacteria bacterium]